MTWTLLHEQKDFKAAMKRFDELADKMPALGSKEGKELELLGFLIQDFEDRAWVRLDIDPIEAIRERMEQMHIGVADLLDVFGDRGTASKVMNGERSLSLPMIRKLAVKLSLPVDILIRPVGRQNKKYSAKPAKTMQAAESNLRYAKKKKRTAR
ncbi:MAG: type II toxin-antitoxin system HigA family antitoxin [Cyclobacteriaceae bacterium]|jgi:HTH-type transcriptional regulator/antitoxin HigA